MKQIFLASLSVILLSFPVPQAFGQQTVVFNVDLKPQLEDSVFIPGRGDVVELTGDLYPLERNRNLKLADQEPEDSVYTVEIEFRGNHQGKTLSYNFLIRTANQVLTEQIKRKLILRKGKVILAPLEFNAFAW